MSEHENTPAAPGPSAEDALRWAWAALGKHPKYPQPTAIADEFLTCDQFVARGLAALTRAPGGQDAG